MAATPSQNQVLPTNYDVTQPTTSMSITLKGLGVEAEGGEEGEEPRATTEE